MTNNFDNIFNYIDKTLNYNSSLEEREEWSSILINPRKIIIEKNTPKKNNSSYNFGNYFISKEQDSKSVLSIWSDEFIDKYFSSEDKKILNFLQKQMLTLYKVNIFLIIANEIKLKKMIQED